MGGLECIPETPDLKVYGHIYAIGDIACPYDPKTGKPTALVARAAINQADIAAKNIIEEIKKERRFDHRFSTYVYKWQEYPYVIPVGGRYAVAKLGPVIISGFLGWVLKELVELRYFLSIMPFFKAVKIWLKSLWVFSK